MAWMDEGAQTVVSGVEGCAGLHLNPASRRSGPATTGGTGMCLVLVDQESLYGFGHCNGPVVEVEG